MRTSSIIAILIIFFSEIGSFSAMANSAWSKRSTGIIERKVNCLLIDSHAPGFILAGTDKAIYRATSQHSSFIPVLQNHGNALAIHQICRNTAVSASLYSATDSGVFVSDDLGLTWQSIFSPANVLARQASSVLVDENTIYVATAGGLYFRQQSGQAWQQVHRDIGQKRVSSLVGDGDYVYAATDSGVYRLAKSKEEVVKVYALGSRSLDEQDVSDGEMALSAQIKDMVVSDDGKKIIVVTTQKIIFSSDQGGTWQQISAQGLPVSGIGKLWIDYTESGAETLYAAGDGGLFSYENGYWENNLAQVGNISVNDAVKDEEGNIYLASADGIYFKSVAYANTKGLGGGQIDYADMALDYKNEPTIRDVQQMAIEYANVDPKQINSWHNQSRMKAFFPTWSMGLSRADSDIYHWDTGANPDVLTKGRDYVDWSTSLSWDFSDLIWSSDHTSIDSRSKLMSELRQDILDQATRLYFERRRIQMELAAKKEMTMDLYIEKTIRLQELTALLDGLTGGEFSQR